MAVTGVVVMVMMAVTGVVVVVLPGLEDAEFGVPRWAVGRQRYVFLTETSVVAVPVRFGAYQLVHIDLATLTWTRLDDVPLCELSVDCLAQQSETSVVTIGSGATSPRGVYRVSGIGANNQATTTLVWSSVDQTFPAAVFSSPEAIRFTTSGEPRLPGGTFAGGLCVSGVGDVAALAAELHKMESHYMGVLLRLAGKTNSEKDALFRSRSLLEIKRVIEGRAGGGTDVELIVLKAEGHDFRRAESFLTVLVKGKNR
ncbi:hypothetical protein B0T24DRAFT_704460 [Lasiosphaeria ovina]|uniref:Uncharacterized protein n=1 Tax=Lasiosphaeria ovina TaxID=92902 RepID=A0AAE0N828_9PEZI|nr:hypothetical protein B0T24DRAFT_704460 [Lasiosphaeria ovina]